eukprot:TRINITY_DN17619_c5_g1_i2.p1 TRINITY_DN17619_c5_g1~~TRINITY_DN17619_c5_g1_i2.p1  ORF type:complete len:302 (+),score=68.45 TRINITY_DN17619_c5_g1_i2:53-907(+)
MALPASPEDVIAVQYSGKLVVAVVCRHLEDWELFQWATCEVFGAIPGEISRSSDTAQPGTMLESVLDRTWAETRFLLVEAAGARALGVASNQKKRERAARIALAVTNVLDGKAPSFERLDPWDVSPPPPPPYHSIPQQQEQQQQQQRQQQQQHQQRQRQPDPEPMRPPPPPSSEPPPWLEKLRTPPPPPRCGAQPNIASRSASRSAERWLEEATAALVAAKTACGACNGAVTATTVAPSASSALHTAVGATSPPGSHAPRTVAYKAAVACTLSSTAGETITLDV